MLFILYPLKIEARGSCPAHLIIVCDPTELNLENILKQKYFVESP